jgi:hypothetical protein
LVEVPLEIPVGTDRTNRGKKEGDQRIDFLQFITFSPRCSTTITGRGGSQ